MVTSTQTLKRVQEAVDRHHSQLTEKLLGTSPEDSLMRAAYYHIFLNPSTTDDPPRSLSEAEAKIRQSSLPDGNDVVANLNETDTQVETLIGGLAASTKAKISSLIRENNQNYYRNSLQNPDRLPIQDVLVKESTLGSLKEKLRETTPKASNQFRSIVITELSNIVGSASVDRIVDEKVKSGEQVNPSQIFVFRVPVNDSATCFSVDELILMSSGQYKRLGDIRPGDKVQCAVKTNGEGSTVLYTNTIWDEVFEYEMNDGTKITCTSDHPILIRSKYFVGFLPMRVLEKSLIPFDVIKYPQLTYADKWKIGRVNSWAKEMGCEDDDLFYFWITKGLDLVKSLQKAESHLERRQLLWGMNSQQLRDLLRLSGFSLKRNYISREYSKPIKTKKSLGLKMVVQVELDQKTKKNYVNKDGVISHNCRYCRRFYGDAGETPKVYRLSSLLANGSNVGLPKLAWKPVVGSTHPNTRTSQIIELPPGYIPVAGGSVEFVGQQAADKWISENLTS